MNQKYYRPSGRIPFCGWLLFMSGGILSAWILSFVYILITTSINFIYANAFITLFFGGLFGLCLAFFVRKGHLRSPVRVGFWAFLLGVCATWIQWIFFYAYYHYGHDDPHNLVDIYCFAATHPEHIFRLMKDLFENGHFGLRHSNAPINSYTLLSVWVLEAIMIVAPSVTLSVKESRKPFSEIKHSWATQERLPVIAAVFVNVDEGKAALEKGDFSVLNPGTVGESYMNLDIYSVKDDNNCHYLSVETVEVTVKKDKKGEKKTTVVDFLRITPEAEKILKERFSVKSDPEGLANAAEDEDKPVSEV